MSTWQAYTRDIVNFSATTFRADVFALFGKLRFGFLNTSAPYSASARGLTTHNSQRLG
jgi:hypothetical protein